MIREFIAQLNVDAVMQYGAIGTMLIWFALRFEAWAKSITESVNDLARVNIIDILTRDTLTQPIIDELHRIKSRTELRTKK